ncbi:FG-GAP repeat domain-containing protein [Zavarzinella formosa]|uniref:FG-GAP repeat domain-containing protein n=1 Tax=Zavarzinella formosa TaxID=360055 RepID=UPI0002D581A9|nr:VCBS repeat-containing protein [Zavarzinella formosa]
MFKYQRSLLAAALLLATTAAPVRAYIEAPMTLADVINQSQMITILRVTRVEKAKSLIVYEKVEDVKGKMTTPTVRHVITGQLKEGETKTVLDWAEPGKIAIFFMKDGQCETCIDLYWYQIYKNGDDLYGMSHGEPFLLRSYAGKAERLLPYVRTIMDNKEAIVPAMEDNKDLLHKRAGRIMRLKTSLKNISYDPKRDFAGWGAEDIRRIQGGTGFSHIGALGKVDADARAVSSVDFDGDGKPDLCVVSTSVVKLYQNQGDAFGEVALPGYRGGARSASWGDYNGDGQPDLLLATAMGAKLFTNMGGGIFRDDTAYLPRDVAGATAAAFLDADGDGKPDVMVATAFNGLRLYLNKRPADLKQPAKDAIFDDVSARWGLEELRLDRIESLAVMNGDGKPDVLLGVGSGVLLINNGASFFVRPDTGLKLDGSKAVLNVIDFNADGLPDVFAVESGKLKLFRNDGTAKFTDVTAQSGDLAKPIPGATSAAWGDFNNDGLPDVMIGVLRGSNRYLQNVGNGVFKDMTAEVGLTGKVTNTQALALVDLNNDGKIDLVLANEGQDSLVLLGNKELPAKATAVNLDLPAEMFGTNALLKVSGNGVNFSRSLVMADSRGQPGVNQRLVLPPGKYQMELKDGNKTQARELIVTDAPARVRWNAKPEATTPMPPMKK